MADDGRRGYEPKAEGGCGLVMIICALIGFLLAQLMKRYGWW